VQLVCELHPAYRQAQYRFSEPRSSEDFALCLLDDGDQPVPAFDKLLFEVIDVATVPSAREPVLMTGWGCDRLTMAPNGVLNWVPRTDTLRIGDSRIDTTVGQWAASPAYVTTLAAGARDVALCPGDSGGPVFTGVTAKQPGGARRIRGVNSKVCTRRAGDAQICTLGTGFGEWSIVSSMSATAYKSFAGWATDWASRQDEKKPVICGINRNAGEPPCRD
jgi:hypothetical protein